MKTYVVIGANYGDEGKGLITDYLADKTKAHFVVRFNGGAQAGHTVQHAGRRHIFSHLSAGTFAFAATYLTKDFVCFPALLAREAKMFSDNGWPLPNLYVHPQALMTTPFDALLNQAAERVRANGRHGSCGIGFNETIERCRQDYFRTTVNDSAGWQNMPSTLRHIAEEWVPTRARALGVWEEQEFQRQFAFWRSSKGIMVILGDIMKFWTLVNDLAGYEILANKRVVFEGAQGLGLDKDYGEFPYVTRSNTGLKQALEPITWAGYEVEAVYVTRTYLTRHGPGPLPNEVESPETISPFIAELTNVNNEWQGGFRYAPLNVGTLADRIGTDLNHLSAVQARLAVTCCDQTPAVHPLLIGEATGYAVGYTGNGPNRNSVLEHIE